jgi:hypothetical protein
MLLSVLLIQVLSSNAQSAPKREECPVSDLDEIQEAVRSAPSCERSLKLFELCGAGATSDNVLGGIVTEKCEADFIHKLSKSQKRAYEREQDRCVRKYRHQIGSMYISFSAFCVAEVARSYSQRFRSVKHRP